MPKKEEKPPKPVPQPSEPIVQKGKDKKDKDKEKMNKAKKLENVEITAAGAITAGTWVAEFDSSTVRKNTLRT